MNTVIQARIDAESKRQAEHILEQMGISLNDAVRMMVKQIIQSRALPFQPHIVYDEPGKELEKILNECEDDIRAGRISKPYTDVDEMMNDLLKD